MTNPDTLRLVRVADVVSMIEKMTAKYGNPIGTDYKQGIQDHGHRIRAQVLKLAAARASLLGEGWGPSLESIARAADPKAWAFYDKWIAHPAMIAECEFEVAASKRIAETILALPAAPIGAK